VSVTLAIAVSAALVWLIERTDLRGGSLIFALILLPIAIPGMVKAIGWALLANPNQGILNVFARNLFGFDGPRGPLNIYSLGGIIFVSALSHIPSITLMIAGAFRNFDPTLEEASEVSGASWLRTQRLITIPLLKPSLLAAFVYFLASTLDDFQIPAILGLNANINVFSTRIYLATTPARGLPDFGLASTYAMLLLLMALGLLMIYRRMMRSTEKFAVVSGKNYRPARSHLGRWSYLAYAGVGIYLLLAAVLPMLTLIWVSLQPFYANPSWAALSRVKLVHYIDLFEMGDFQHALMNTVIISPVVATATMVLATLISWNSMRNRFRGAAIPDYLTFANLAVPTVVFALAVLFVYLGIPVLRPVYGTIWLLVIVFTTRYLTYTTRLMGGAVIQIHKELEEASEASGASQWQTFRNVTLPLLMPSFLNGWMWVAVHAVREGTLAVILMTPANVVLASMIWSEWRNGNGYGEVAAMSVLVVTLTAGMAMLARLPIFSRVKG
jgi:iron(III) transport system permease protein